MIDCHLPISTVAKWLHLKYSRLLKIVKLGINDPIVAFAKYKPRMKFKKLHNKAREIISELIQNSTKPL